MLKRHRKVPFLCLLIAKLIWYSKLCVFEGIRYLHTLSAEKQTECSGETIF
ncbi:hypothetical protein VIBNIMADA3020_520050 [Vibrio nigripulchritudo MADA3020]|nr:hypothetical protein VIBNIMADA3020_520050 [Vibrio nigripulchritudo MADA3020]